ncbi:MAG: glycosyltransferase family 2 protein [Chloroflexota bacterium]
MNISIVIPAYNEQQGVTITLDKLRAVMSKLEEEHTVQVVFVDDGSHDDTLKLLNSACADDKRFIIVPQLINQGPGAAIRTGFAYAKGDIIVTTDFDGTYDFNNIPLIVEKMINSKVDVITASPYHTDGGVEGVPAYRLLFSYVAALLYRLLVDMKIATWTAFFRAYRRDVADKVRFESNDFLGNTELLVRAIQKGYKVDQFPTVLRTRQFGQSSIRIARVTRSHLLFQSRLILESWRNVRTFKLPDDSIQAIEENAS